MATQTEISHNPAARASGKRGLHLAAKVARALGVVPTWPNIQTIRLAIEAEAAFSFAPPEVVASMLILAGQEFTAAPQYVPLSEPAMREIGRLNTVDRFWFEDARWRDKAIYSTFRSDHREQSS